MPWWPTKQRDRDLERELQSDLELEEEEQREHGLSPEEARYAARRAFGNPTVIREQTRETWGWAPVEGFLRDLRFAWRLLLKSPIFTVTAIVTLALGIGATTAIFSTMDALLLRRIPVPNPQRIVYLTVPGGQPYGASSTGGTPTARFLSLSSKRCALTIAYCLPLLPLPHSALTASMSASATSSPSRRPEKWSAAISSLGWVSLFLSAAL